MTDVGAVIVVGLSVGQIDEVVQEEGYRQREDDQRRLWVAVHGRNVESDPRSIENGHEEVHSLELSRFELLLKLPKPFVRGEY